MGEPKYLEGQISLSKNLINDPDLNFLNYFG